MTNTMKRAGRGSVVALVLALAVALGVAAGNIGRTQAVWLGVPSELRGRVVGITDGDTLTLLTADHVQHRIRLAEIDAPEHDQPYGAASKQVLSGLAYMHDVRVVVVDYDRYGRTVGRIYAGSLDVNAEMVREGAAWAYRQYLHDPHLLALEQEAKRARRGLWRLQADQITPPWEWRAAERGGRHMGAGSRRAPLAQSAGSQQAPMGATCGSKHYCREMTSCAEARFYLNQCRVVSLDGNHDGIPCNSLCR